MPTFSATHTSALRQEPRRIAFITYDGVKMLDITGPLQVFADANEILGFEAYTTTLASLYGGPVETDTGVALNTRRLAGVGLDDAGTLIACGGKGVHDACRDNRLVGAIRLAAQKCGRAGATCTGAFLLGASDLLDGRRSVTHWKDCDRLAEAYPQTQVDPDPIFIEDRGVWTSAGVTAGIDLALAMVEKDYSRDVAMELARHLLVYVKRPGGQSQFSEALQQQTRTASGRFGALHLWMKDNLVADLRVEELAKRVGMSPRNFARIYADDTGQTPARAVEMMRIEAARIALEDPELTVKQVSVQCGFGSDERMRRSFIRQLGVSPQAYRNSFALSE